MQVNVRLPYLGQPTDTSKPATPTTYEQCPEQAVSTTKPKPTAETKENNKEQYERLLQTTRQNVLAVGRYHAF